MESLSELFLSPAALERVLIYMCRSGAGHSTDPITEAMQVLLSCPVQFTITRCGVGLFKGQPVFPYCYMTPQQRKWVHELTQAIAGGSDLHPDLQRLDDPITYLVENDCIVLKAGASAGPALCPNTAFDVLLGCMTRTEQPARARLLLGLLLQRIAIKVKLSRETLAHIDTECRRLLEPS